jgi:hypothetical protein
MTDAAGKGLFPGAAIAQNLLAWCQFCFDLTDGMTSACFGTAGVPSSGEPGRQGMSARQETIDRYRHFRAIAKQHLGGALKHLSRTAIKEAAQRVGLWSRGKLVMDSPDELDLVFDVAVFDTRSGQSRALDRYARAHPAATGSDEALTLDGSATQPVPHRPRAPAP